MDRCVPVISSAVDHEGRTWDVTEVRPTGYGFDLLLGWPEDMDRGLGRGRSRVILTPELVGLVRDADKAKDLGLPAEVQHIRKRLGLTKHNAPHTRRPRLWWVERLPDLLGLTVKQFADKHGVSQSYVVKWRKRLTGLTAKEANAVRKGFKRQCPPS